MFYIVETHEQLRKLIEYGNTKAFIEIIPLDDRIHPVLNKPSLIYLRPLAPVASTRGFIICVDHTESAFKLEYNSIMESLMAQIPEIWTIDIKNTLYYGFENRPLNSLKMAYMLSGMELEHPLESFNTRAHGFYAQKLEKRTDINRFIPISKHYEKYENFFRYVKFPDLEPIKREFDFYNNKSSRAFQALEKSGIGIDKPLFDKNFSGTKQFISIKDDRFYTQYNLYNPTARPTSKFNGVNLMALKKKDGIRKTFVPKNDFFVQFDYNSYQVKLLADLIGYDFGDENIHEHLAKYYFNVETVTEEQYDAGKLLTFRHVYGRSAKAPDVPFFQQVYELRDYLWNRYNEDGYIKSAITGRKIFGITENTHVLPYLMQAHETERNVRIMSEIHEFLSGKKTKFVLYIYDAFLFDVCKQEGPETLAGLQEIIEQENYQTTIKSGENYDELQEI